ncbi:hypothetical protein BIV25_44565 [Streptomyces sp. MUSC 14]|nr:hypothetical protein BIV25_44565 [Streptomyces sp. MUSC 14]
MPEVGHLLHLVHQPPGEQPPGRRFAVPVNVVEHQLRVLHRAHPPVADLVAGQVREDELLLLVSIVDGRDGRGDRTRRGHHDRHDRCDRRGLHGGYLRGRGFGAGLRRRLPGADLLPLGLAGPRPG